MWIKLDLNQTSSCMNEKLGDLETDWLGDKLGDWPGDLAKWLLRGSMFFFISVRASGAGIKMEGLLYLQKYSIGGPEFGIKEEFVTVKGRQLFHAHAMNREVCCLQLGQLTGANWNHTLVSGFTPEKRLLHPTTALRPSTSELLTEIKTLSSFQL